MTTNTTYKTTRTTNVEVTRQGARGRAAPAFAPLTVAITAPGALQISGVRPDVLAERLPHIVRLLTR